jgi:hypothetical protein
VARRKAVDGFDRLSAHALRVGFITAAYDKGVHDEDIMRHTRHRDLCTVSAGRIMVLPQIPCCRCVT